MHGASEGIMTQPNLIRWSYVLSKSDPSLSNENAV
jgi:hypothetical protein